MSARSLLDVISFKGLYLSSLQPTVVLNRLDNTEMSKKPPVNKSPNLKPKTPVTRSRSKKYVQIKEKVKNRLATKRTVLKKRPCNNLNKRKYTDDFNNVEDNTPLKHFATSSRQQEGDNVKRIKPNNRIILGSKPSTSKPFTTEQTEPRITTEQRADLDDPKGLTNTLSTSGYYGVQEIQKWMAESISQSPAQELLEGFPERATLILNPEGIREFQENIAQEILEPVPTLAENNDICPCAKYIKIEDITRPENRSDFEKRCCKCRRCRCVEKLGTLTTLFSGTSNEPNESNVYIFDTNTDNVEGRPASYQTCRQSTRAAVTAAEKGNLYIDMCQELPQLIEISKADENGIMHAKLVPRSEANPINEFSLIEHENLLDQLLATVKASGYRQLQGSVLQLHDHEVQPPQPRPSGCEQEEVVVNSPPSMNNAEVERSHHSSSIHLTSTLRQLVQEEGSLKESTESDFCLNYEQSDEEAIPGTSTCVEENEQKDGILLMPGDQVCSGVATRSMSRCAKTAEPCSLSSATALSLEGRKEMDEALSSGLVDAPVYYPSASEFQDPIKYFESIMPDASKFGLCKVVAPPDFKPPCTLNEDIRFKVVNQYVSRLYSRWGPVARKMCAIKAYMAKQKVKFTRAPLLDGMEVNLPKLHSLVQRHGGIMEAIKKKRLGRIAEQMGFSKSLKPYKKMEMLYFKYLLPYAALTSKERQELLQKVDREWFRKYSKMLKRAANPLHRKKRLLGDSESTDEDTEEETHISEALSEAEDCISTGRTMSLSAFRKIAKNTMDMFFPNSSESLPLTKQVEAVYWNLVSKATEHVCVNTASVDTGDEGYVFTKEKTDNYSKHPWNLKMLSQNAGNVLRFLGQVLGVTVPTLHLGMLFSTSCWHRDPHGLPWMEYMHEGPGKVWYGIPNEQTSVFRQALVKLCPTVCQSKPVWLPSDVIMVPPELLLKHNVPLSRVVQHPGEFIIVFPNAYSCSISTGLTVSESVYFATHSWLNDVHQLFNKLKFCCEPTMFSLERLLVEVAKDWRAPYDQLIRVRRSLVPLIETEQSFRSQLKNLAPRLQPLNCDCRNNRRRSGSGWNVQEQDECEICRSTLFFAKVTGLIGGKSSVCIEHAVRLLSGNKPVPHQATLIKHISDEELVTLLASLDNRIAENN